MALLTSGDNLTSQQAVIATHWKFAECCQANKKFLSCHFLQMFSKIGMLMVFPHRVQIQFDKASLEQVEDLLCPLTQRFVIVFSKSSGKSDNEAVSDGLRYKVCLSGKYSFSLCAHLQTKNNRISLI